ncbi:MAG: THUMP domain-containing protein [Candidatus Eisenbacteria bacterium]|uniref:Methyltransferase n=1 Tax=Eiseniibacteriota bacterium TaxID=2212470 RepID=A0A956RNT6_UNCEI|nr:methyltransferase [Candidatus Eisenbacteria bacterium]
MRAKRGGVMADERFYATVGVGVERIVSGELQALGIRVARTEPGRVRFEGSLDDLSRALIHLRCASRVVREILFQEVEREGDLYDVVRSIDWSRWLTPDMTFRVALNAHSSLLRNSQFGVYRVKDAICDAMVERVGRRPSVDREAPDLHVACYLENRRFSVGLDGAGTPLHMRGYRVGGHESSLREHLAAAMLLQSRWDPARPLHDPFCGSGTILIEAAMIATHTPPSLWRKRFGCMSWPDFDRARFDGLRAEARAAITADEGLRITGADRSRKAIESARANVTAAGFDDVIRLRVRDVAEMTLESGSWVVTNPPYGVRVGDEETYKPVWNSFRDRLLGGPGAQVAVLAPEEGFEREFRMRPFKRNRMNNGPIRCVLSQYRIHE